ICGHRGETAANWHPTNLIQLPALATLEGHRVNPLESSQYGSNDSDWADAGVEVEDISRVPHGPYYPWQQGRLFGLEGGYCAIPVAHRISLGRL
ncbi:MAG: hypothetical protein ACJ04O_05255, partial [Cellvibrionales bacterium]